MNDYTKHCMSKAIIELAEAMHDEFGKIDTDDIVLALHNTLISKEDAEQLTHHIRDIEK